MTDVAQPGSEQAVFITPDDGAQIDVRIASETVWLTQAQIAELFGVQVPAVSKHLANVYEEGELERPATISKMETVRREGRRSVQRSVDHYSLDAVISVGYRVNSKTATAFRQWATRVLRQHLVGDYKKRADDAAKYLAGLKTVELLAHHADADAAATLALIGRYARAWHLLLQYDENRLPALPTQVGKRMQRLTPTQANRIIDRFEKTLAQSGQSTDLFGRARGDGLASILRNLEQTFGSEPLYPNVETRAAHLLYLVIKDHPFFDGNKRIGSLLFLHYLGKNGRRLLDESTLVALALLIAESDPKQKDIVVRLIISLMEDRP